jgi:tripartite-type tricarboxylate transporter receptor subunit TctC
MKPPCHRVSRRAAAAIFIAVMSNVLFVRDSAWSETRIIKLVVPFPGGGLNESMFRVVADQIGHQGGPTFVIEARPGAATMIATEAVSRAAPDGNTVLLVSNSFIINPYVRKLTYDPLTSFEPICYLWRSPNIFAVNSASHYHTLGDLLAAARGRPGELTMAATGPATGVHVAVEQLKQAAHVDLIFVPFNGAGPVVNALLGDHVASALADYGLMEEHFKSGKLRPSATTGRSRVESLPEVPTVAESGFRNYDLDIWYGLVAPAKTPKDKIGQFADWLTSALKDPGVRAKLVDVGLYPVGTCGVDFATHLRAQYEDYGHIIRSANIRAE